MAASLLSLPAAVACAVLSEPFLSCREVRDLAATCRHMLDSLRAFRINALFIQLDAAFEHAGISIEADDSVGPPRKHARGALDCRFGIIQSVCVQSEHTENMWRHLPLLRTVRCMLIDNFAAWPPIAADASLVFPAGLIHLDFSCTASLDIPLSSFALPPTLEALLLPMDQETALCLDRVRWPPALTTLHHAFDTHPVRAWRLPPRLRTITFGFNFNRPLSGDECLPASITSLGFGGAFNSSLAKFCFPPQLEQIEINSLRYDHALDLLHLPSSCSHVRLPMGGSTHWLAQLLLPDSVRELFLGGRALDSFAAFKVPASLTHLTLNHTTVPFETINWPPALGPLKLELLGCNHALAADQFPPQLTSLHLQHLDLPFDQLLLPAGLTSLSFGVELDHPLAGLRIPASLASLEVAGKSIPLALPLKATGLLSLPSAVLCVALADGYLTDRETRDLAATCKLMVDSLRPYRIRAPFLLHAAFDHLPVSDSHSDDLHSLLPSDHEPAHRWRIGQVDSVEVHLEHTTAAMIARLFLLRSVRSLEFHQYSPEWPQAADGAAGDATIRLPSSLSKLRIGSEDKSTPPLSAFQLPDTLAWIALPAGDQAPPSQGLDRVHWPPALTKLVHAFDSAPVASWRLPDGLRILDFSDHFNQPVEGVQLPDSIQELSFGKQFVQSLSAFRFPAQLHWFGVASPSYAQPLDLRHLPPSCTRLLLPAVLESAQTYAPLQLPATTHEVHIFVDDLLTPRLRTFDGLRLPASLTSLVLEGAAQLDSLQWPGDLGPLKLELLGGFDCPLPAGHLPASTTALDLGGGWNRPVSELALPSSLLSLRFGWWFDQPVAELLLPASLTDLQFGCAFLQPLHRLRWPSRLRSLLVCYRKLHAHEADGPLGLPGVGTGSGLPVTLERVAICAHPSRVCEVEAAWRSIVAQLPACRLVLEAWRF